MKTKEHKIELDFIEELHLTQFKVGFVMKPEIFKIFQDIVFGKRVQRGET